MTSDFIVFHEKIYDFVSTPLFGFNLVTKPKNSILQVIKIL